MSLLAFGVNHQSASVDLREQLSFSPSDIPSAIQTICKEKLANEVVMLSTCNRTEMYLAEAQPTQRLYEWLSDTRKVSVDKIQQHAYLYKDKWASRHLFRVATGLDSLALGEPQILGQIKEAYQVAIANNGVKNTLNRLFQEAFYIAKNVRSDTKLGENSISVVYAGVKLSEQFYSDYGELTALVIGAGQTSELAVKHLHKKGVGKIIVANRTLTKAQNLASSVNGYAITLDHIPHHLHEADIIVSATGRGEFTVTAADIEAGQKKRRYRMQLLLDYAVPRDIDPAIRKLSNSYVFGVDNLQNIIDKNQDLRQQAASQAELMIDDYNRHFHEWLQLRQHHNLIRGVHQFAQNEKEKLTEQALRQLANGENPEQVLQELATRLTKKLTHQPSILIRRAGEQGQIELLDSIKSIYNLD